MNTPLRILSLEDDEDDYELICATLLKEGIDCEIVRVSNRQDFLAAVWSKSFEIILADHSLPGFDGIAALDIAREHCPDVPFIFVSGVLGEELAIETLRSGATDYVLKTRLSRLGFAVKRALRETEDRVERKIAEDAYRAVVENSIQGLVIFQEGRIVFANPAMETISGCRLEELFSFTPRQVWERIHPEDRRLIRQKMNGKWQDAPLEPGFGVRFFRKDKTICWLSIFASTIEYRGQPALQSACVDITERKLAEEALRESEERYRLLVENSTDLVAELSPAGKFLYVSPNYRSILGYEQTALIQTDVLANVYGREQSFVRSSFYQEKVPVIGPYRYRHADGSWHWLESSSQRYNTSSGEERIVMVSRDVTQKKIADEELVESRKQLQRFSEHLENTLDEERKRISREIHDELGQLLTILKFDISWLKLNLSEKNPVLAEKIDSMLEAVGQALGSVKRISKEIRPPQLEVLGLCGAIQWDLSQFSAKVGIRSTIRISPSEFTLDKDRNMVVYRVFHEALTNVIRHAQASSINVELDRKSDSVVLRVQDDGRGISKKELQGTISLGLVGMRERIRPWNGTLTIAGKRGKGTLVVMQIPVDEINKEGTPP
ncbi:MAG: PAS domain S-box protein [bacterium]